MPTKPGPGTVLLDSALTEGLVGAWLFNEGEGGTGDTVLDYSGLGHHGVIENGAGTPGSFWASVDPNHDPAFVVDKSPVQMWLRIPDHADFDFSSEFTVAIGYAVPALGDLSNFDVLVGKASTDAWNDGFTLYTCQAGKVDWGFDATIHSEGLQDQGSGTTPYNDSLYHQTVVTFKDSTDTEILYVDGVEKETKTNATTAPTTNAVDLYIGRQANATTRNFSAYVFYCYMWNRVLPAAEVASLAVDPYQIFSVRGLSASMLSELQGLARVVPVFELDLGGETLQFANPPVTSGSTGLYKPYLTEMSGFGREANAADFTLQIPSPSVTIFDRDRKLQKAIGGPQKARIRNATARAYFVSSVAGVTRWKFFDGVVSDYQLSRDRVYRFSLFPARTEPLFGQPKIPFHGPPDFPTAPKDFIGLPHHIVYGKLASAGITGAAGMVAALPAVEDANGDCVDWVLAYGQLTIQRIYRTITNELTEDTPNWAFYTLERGLHRYQMGRYTGGGTKPKPDDDVRVDCQGLFADAPVSGITAPFENPAACMRNFLAHFVYGDGDVRDGVAWTSESGLPIASSIWDRAEAYFDDRAHVMAKVIQAGEKAIDVFNDWCKAWNAAPFFTDAWAIAAMPEDEAETDIYLDDRHVSQSLHHALSDLRMETSRSQPLSEIQINYLLDEAEGSLTQSRTVTDPAATNTVRDTFDFEWGEKSLID